nr:hypothetical protein Iba_scaffold4357CG0100 [Ipomoea batatas]
MGLGSTGGGRRFCAEPVELLRDRNCRDLIRLLLLLPFSQFKLKLLLNCQNGGFDGGGFSCSDEFSDSDRSSLSICRFVGSLVEEEEEGFGGVDFLRSTGRILPLAKSSSAEEKIWSVVMRKSKSTVEIRGWDSGTGVTIILSDSLRFSKETLLDFENDI